VVEVKE
jgi:hypothetical protein